MSCTARECIAHPRLETIALTRIILGKSAIMAHATYSFHVFIYLLIYS